MDLPKLLEQKSVFLLDGAMGTQLDKRGLMSRGRNNLDAPQAVLEIHQTYAQCGCDAVTTNTATMNRLYIETHDVDVSVEEVNRAGARLADQAVSCGQYVLGNLSSTGKLLKPYGHYTEAQFYEAFKGGRDYTETKNFWFKKGDEVIRNGFLPLQTSEEMETLPPICCFLAGIAPVSFAVSNATIAGAATTVSAATVSFASGASTAGFFCVGCLSTGIPRPLS